MSQNNIIAPILSYDEINKYAEDFLREHKRNEILPVDIEAIAEFDLGSRQDHAVLLIKSVLQCRPT
jgi:hypothetical protein